LLPVIVGSALTLSLLGAKAEALPAWWRAFLATPRLECAFVQESESAVFGKLTREGQLKLAKGGRLRVEYRKGLLLVADGRSLVQYDAEARTAQRLTLRGAVADSPLLNVLIDPGALEVFYAVQAGPDETVALEPRRTGIPRVELSGHGGMLQRIQWTDGTGAKQQIELKDPRQPGQAFAPAVFTFQAPAGTRWLTTH
jgi:outer membrane lipoprotein-sorting protein